MWPSWERSTGLAKGSSRSCSYFSFACGFQRPLVSVLAETYAEATAYPPLLPFTPSDAAVLEILLSALLIPLAFTDLRPPSRAPSPQATPPSAPEPQPRLRPSPSGAVACGGACGGDERGVHPQNRDGQEYHVSLRASGCPRSWCTVPMELCGHLLLVTLCLLAHDGQPRMVVASSTAGGCSSRLCHTLAHRDLPSSGALLSEALPLEAREAAWELWHSPSAWISYVEHVELRAAGARRALGPFQSPHSRCRPNFQGLNFSCARSFEQRHALGSNHPVKEKILALSVHGTVDAHLWGLPRRSLLRH